ncbi:hypothetical protein CRYUN_Cryun29cG0060900 [Craigia yunnanensis]
MLLRLGRLATVVIFTAEAARMVLKNHDLDCCTRPSLVGLGRLLYNYLDISFSPYGDYWRQLRKVCVVEPPNRVQSYRFIREEEVASLINSISRSYSILSPFGNNPVNLTEKLFSFTVSIIFRMAFGKLSYQESCFNNSNDRIEEMVREAMVVLGSFSASEYFPYVEPWLFWEVSQHLNTFHMWVGSLTGLLVFTAWLRGYSINWMVFTSS